MSTQATIARPYAEAVFGLAQDASARARWSAGLAFAATVVSDPKVAALAADPRIPAAHLLSLLKEIGGARFDGRMVGLLQLLLDNERILLLPEIERIFEALRSEAENVLDVEIVSAQPLASTEEADIRTRLEQRFKRRVVVRSRVDVALLAGAVIHIGDRVIDGSLQARLAALATHLNQ